MRYGRFPQPNPGGGRRGCGRLVEVDWQPRGVGAGRRHKARAHLASNPRDLPWQRPGLTRVARLIGFLEFLPVTKGRLAGRRMKLLPD